MPGDDSLACDEDTGGEDEEDDDDNVGSAESEANCVPALDVAIGGTTAANGDDDDDDVVGVGDDDLDTCGSG